MAGHNTTQSQSAAPDFEHLFERHEGNCYPAMVDHLANELGVTAESLRRQRIGFAPIVQQTKAKTGEKFNVYAQWSMAMRNAKGDVVGISTRDQRTGNKYTLSGSELGFFYTVNPEHSAAGTGYHAGPENWVRTKEAGHVCPVCGKPDGCLVSSEDPADPKAVVCIRVREGAVKPQKFGYLHIRKPEGRLNTKTDAHVLPGDPDADPVIVVEGYTDTAALTDLGLVGLGRPNNLAKTEEFRELVKGRHVVVVGENDKKPDGTWPGKEGMHRAGEAIAVKDWVKSVTLVMPPKDRKDFRAWKVNGGLTRDGFLKYVKTHGHVLTLKAEVAAAPRSSQADQIVNMISDRGVESFHYRGRGYLVVPVATGENSCHRVYPIRSRSTADYLRMQFYKDNKKGPPKSAVDDAVNTLEAAALFTGPEIPVFLRVGYDPAENAVYLDLADDAGRVVKVTAEGVTVATAPKSIRFLHTSSMRPLPVPRFGGSWETLRQIINAKDDEVWVLVISWLLSVFNPHGPRPILSVRGSQGTGKSTTVAMLVKLVDPSDVLLRHMPKTERDLAVAVHNAQILAIDNGSKIPEEMSDALCGIATGTGFVQRALFTDTDESRILEKRSMALNGIPDILAREDLKDRSLQVLLRMIESSDRRTEAELWAEFDQAHSSVLGLLLTAISTALRNLAGVVLSDSPRMMDFARWIVAAEPSLPWEPGTFMRLYMENRAESSEAAIESSAVATAVVGLMTNRVSWSGTASELLAALADVGRNGISSRPDFPKFPKATSDALARVEPALRSRSIFVNRRRTNGTRIITVSKRA